MSNKAPGVPLDSILYYRPSTGGNLIFGILYVVAASLIALNLVSRRDWWGLCLPIGATLQGIGFFLRLPLQNSPDSLGLYIIMDFFIVLSPACYFAFNYIWFGRLVHRMEESLANEKPEKHLTLLPPRKFGLIFILSDVTTFLIQAAGGGMTVQANLKNVGSKIFLIGIIAQFASYLLFIALTILFAFRVKLFSKAESTQNSYLQQRIRQMIYILIFSSFWIIVRSVYRTIELAQGYDGTLAENEAWFFSLDSAPLLLAISIYVFAWPCSFIELKSIAKDCLVKVPWNFGAHSDQYDWKDTNSVDESFRYVEEKC